MRFQFRGKYSRGTDSLTLFGVTFEGDKPEEVTEAPAIKWFAEHPDFVEVEDAPEVDLSNLTVTELEKLLGDDLAKVKGTGKGGNVVKKDLIKALRK